MHLSKLGRMVLLATLLPSLASATNLIVEGNTQVFIKAHYTRPTQLEVTDDKGGWFDQGLEMIQLGGWETPYNVTARLRVTASNPTFQVRLGAPLEIRNQARPDQMFRNPVVTLGADGEPVKTLLVGQNISFTNPDSGTEDDSIGFYALSVSALPPEGDFTSTAGKYSGVLTMIFEPTVTRQGQE